METNNVDESKELTMAKRNLDLEDMPTRVEDLTDDDFRVCDEFTYPVRWKGKAILPKVEKMLERVCERADMMVTETTKNKESLSQHPPGEVGKPVECVTFQLVSMKLYTRETDYRKAKDSYLKILHEEQDAMGVNCPIELCVQFASPWAFVRAVNALRENKHRAR